MTKNVYTLWACQRGGKSGYAILTNGTLANEPGKQRAWFRADREAAQKLANKLNQEALT